MPDFIAVCEPLIFENTNVPALSPTIKPPENSIFGNDWRPPFMSALAPYVILWPPFKCDDIAGCVFQV